MKRKSAENSQRSLAVSDLWLTLCRYIIYNLCGSRWLEYGRVHLFVKRPKTVWKGLELQIDGPLFQKRTVIHRRSSDLCQRLHRRKPHEKVELQESVDDSFGFVSIHQITL